MQFLAPFMLFGLAAIAAPVLIHLFSRRNRRSVEWGAWMFLDEVIRRRRRRMLIEDLLLLALRCLAVIAVALAFSRPFLRRLDPARFGLAADKDVALVIDASSSMSLAQGGETNFARALEEARRLVRESPRGTSFSLILAGPVPHAVVPVPLADRRAILAAIDRLRPSAGAMRAVPNLAAAAATLAAGGNAAKLVAVIGDAQRDGWASGSPDRWKALRQVFDGFGFDPPVVWRTLAMPSSVRNLAVASIRASRATVGAGCEVRFTVRVVNAGNETATPGALSFTAAGKVMQGSGFRRLEPGESQEFEFSCRFDSPGAAEVVAALPHGDDLAADDEARLVVPVVDSLAVLVVEGGLSNNLFERSATCLALALRPELARLVPGAAPAPDDRRRLFDVRIESAERFAHRKDFSSLAAVVLSDPPALPAECMKALGDYVEKGGALLVLPGRRTDGASWSAWNEGGRPVLPAAIGPRTGNPDGAVRVDPASFTGDALRPLREGSDLAGAVPAFLRKLEERPECAAEATARFSSGDPLVVTGRFARGAVAVAAIPFDADSGIVSKRAFVPFVNELVHDLIRCGAVRLDADPGERISLTLASAATAGAKAKDFRRAPVKVSAPGGETIPAVLAAQMEGIVLRSPRGALPGLYTIASPPRELGEALAAVTQPDGSIRFVVGTGEGEGRLEAASAEDLKAISKFIRISTADDPAELLKAVRGEAFGREIWRLFAFLALIALVAETAWCRAIAVSRRTGEKIDVDFRDESSRLSGRLREALAHLRGAKGEA